MKTNNLYIMEYTIIHVPEKQRFETVVDGFTGYVTYEVENGELNINHTIVPSLIEGRGIAAALVKRTFDFAVESGLKCSATCSYAEIWLRRHPEYL